MMAARCFRPWAEVEARMPAGLDPMAGPVIWSLSKAERLDALRRLAVAGLRSGDHEVRAAAELIADALISNRPLDVLADLGISTRGGESPAAARNTAERDAMLVDLRQAVPEWREAPAHIAAVRMVKSFSEYERNSWPRDRVSGIAPATEPRATWFRILALGLYMPRTPAHIADRL